MFCNELLTFLALAILYDCNSHILNDEVDYDNLMFFNNRLVGFYIILIIL